jgi:Protein of unknown function (DUF1428)
MKYVDGYVLPVPKRNLAAYRQMAAKAAKIWRKYGALEFRGMCRRRFENDKGQIVSGPGETKARRNGRVFLDRLQVARAPRPRKRQGDERPTDRPDDAGKENAVRFETHGLRRIQGDGRRVEVSAACAGSCSCFSPASVILC